MTLAALLSHPCSRVHVASAQPASQPASIINIKSIYPRKNAWCSSLHHNNSTDRHDDNKNSERMFQKRERQNGNNNSRNFRRHRQPNGQRKSDYDSMLLLLLRRCGTIDQGYGVLGGECTHVIHGRSCMTIDPRVPTMPGRSTVGG